MGEVADSGAVVIESRGGEKLLADVGTPIDRNGSNEERRRIDPTAGMLTNDLTLDVIIMR